MLIFLAGLQGVPVELEDAARVDGAGVWTKFWNVTFPIITPTIFFNLVIGIVGALQVFTVAVVATVRGYAPPGSADRGISSPAAARVHAWLCRLRAVGQAWGTAAARSLGGESAFPVRRHGSSDGE